MNERKAWSGQAYRCFEVRTCVGVQAIRCFYKPARSGDIGGLS